MSDYHRHDCIVRVGDRRYAANEVDCTFFRVSDADGMSDGDDDIASWRHSAEVLQSFKYWRPGLSAQAMKSANKLADGGSNTKTEDPNVVLTVLRIMKEREFLEAVAAGDDAKLAELAADERGAAMVSARLGGHQIGSIVMMCKEAAA